MASATLIVTLYTSKPYLLPRLQASGFVAAHLSCTLSALTLQVIANLWAEAKRLRRTFTNWGQLINIPIADNGPHALLFLGI